MALRVTNEQVITAYRETGSVWAAGKRIGISGQQVHARLQRMGHATEGSGRSWTTEEDEELQRLVSLQLPFLEIASRLHRSYNGVAIRASRLGLRTERRWLKKIPRGQGYDKKAILKHWKDFLTSGLTLTKFAKSINLNTDTLVHALEKYVPEEWGEYKKINFAHLGTKKCGYCGVDFYPSNSKQQWCTRACGTRNRTDQDYFGGRRKETVGIEEGICQLCGGKPLKGLSSHHVYGKQNDPDNDYLVALCRGCHDVVTRVASRSWALDTAKLESLLGWVWIRANGERLAKEPRDVWASVEVWEELVDPPKII